MGNKLDAHHAKELEDAIKKYPELPDATCAKEFEDAIKKYPELPVPFNMFEAYFENENELREEVLNHKGMVSFDATGPFRIIVAKWEKGKVDFEILASPEGDFYVETIEMDFRFGPDDNIKFDTDKLYYFSFSTSWID